MRLKLRIPRISLRVLLVFMAFLAGCLALSKRTVDRAIQQSRAAARVRRTTGAVDYDFYFPVPRWCVDQFGPDLFATATSVAYFEGGTYPEYGVKGLGNYAALYDLPELQEIDVFDSGFPLEVLNGIPNLTRLKIEQNGLQDDDMVRVARLKHLRVLQLPLNDITDAGALRLMSLKNLTELDLSGNHVTEQAIADLRAALPECRITNWYRPN